MKTKITFGLAVGLIIKSPPSQTAHFLTVISWMSRIDKEPSSGSLFPLSHIRYIRISNVSHTFPSKHMFESGAKHYKQFLWLQLPLSSFCAPQVEQWMRHNLYHISSVKRPVFSLMHLLIHFAAISAPRAPNVSLPPHWGAAKEVGWTGVSGWWMWISARLKRVYFSVLCTHPLSWNTPISYLQHICLQLSIISFWSKQ